MSVPFVPDTFNFPRSETHQFTSHLARGFTFRTSSFTKEIIGPDNAPILSMPVIQSPAMLLTHPLSHTLPGEMLVMIAYTFNIRSIICNVIWPNASLLPLVA